MIVEFENKFKVELKTPGNSFKLCTYRLGSGNDISNYFQFESLWDPDTRILNMALDLSFLRKDLVTDIDRTSDLTIAESCTYIDVYYSDLNDNIIGLAFKLKGDNENDPLNLCSFEAGREITDPTFWRNMNYINLRLPKDTKANIETLEINENTDFLEQLTSTEGINTFLVEGNKENDTILTKNSFAKHVRNTISKNNFSPMYLDYFGEKVLDIETFKYYKKIVITCVGPAKVETLENGTVTCSVNNRSSVAIKGYCLFDKYQVINDEYTLIEENLREDLSKTTLVRLIGGIETSDNVGIEIDQSGKQINIDDVDGVNSEINIAAKLTFTNKLGEEKEEITIVSNIVQINLFFSWYIEYFTSYTQKDDSGTSHPVILFDTTKENAGWTEGYRSDADEENTPGTILVYSSKRIPETGINVTADEGGSKQGIFESYFSVEIEDRGFSEEADKFIYAIKIKTKLENTEDIWCPIDPSTKESTLILMNINIGESIQEGEVSAQFYCVQRVISPLTIGRAEVKIKEQDNSRSYTWIENGVTELTFESGLGLTSLDGLFVCNPKIGYELWEVILDDEATKNLISYNVKNNIETFGATPKEDNEIFFYSRRNSELIERTLGTITFKRINNETKSYDNSYWQDRIYGDESNCATITLKRDALDSDSLWNVRSSTPYSYSDPLEGVSRRLYILSDQETQSFTIESSQSLLNHLSVTLCNYVETPPEGSGIYAETSEEREGLVTEFNKYFRVGEANSNNGNVGIKYSADTLSATITLKAINQDEYDWQPKCNNGKPIRVKISYGSEDESDPLLGRAETFYAIVRPSFAGTDITFRDTNWTDEEYPIMEEYTFPETGGNLPTYVVAPVESGSVGVFDHWIVLKKDPEITVKFQGKPDEGSVNYSCLLITKAQQSIWPALGLLTEISTKSKSEDSLSRDFDDLVIRRAAGDYDNIVEFYSDWLNQVCDHSSSRLKLSLGGAAESKTVKVSYECGGEDNESIEMHNDSLLPLREIGIYRLRIKCEHPFRVTLVDNNEERSSIGFYDSANDIIKRSTMLDINTYDNFVGTEVDLLFLGHENDEDSFSKSNPTLELKTRIQVTNLYDNTSVSFGLERTYYKVVSEENFEGWKEVLYSKITAIDPRTYNIFLPVNSNDALLKYTSAIETLRTVAGHNGITWTRTIKDKPNFSKDLYYRNLSYVNSQNAETNIPGHGYKYNSLDVSVGLISNIGNSYPIKCFGEIELRYQGDYLGEYKTYYFYKLLDVPTATIKTTSEDTSIPGLVIPYNRSSATVEIELPNNGNYRLFFQRAETAVETEIAKDDDTLVPITGSTTLDFFPISGRNNAFSVSIQDINNTAITFLGTLYAKTFVDKNSFAIDQNGEPLVFSEQEEVNRIAGVSTSNIVSVYWGNGEGVADYISGNYSLLSRQGETRTFIIHRADGRISQSEIETIMTNYKSILGSFYFNGQVYEGYNIEWKRLLDQALQCGNGVNQIYTYSNNNYIKLSDSIYYDFDINIRRNPSSFAKFKYLQELRGNYNPGGDSIGLNKTIIIDNDNDLKIPIAQECWEKGIVARRLDANRQTFTYLKNDTTITTGRYLYLGEQNKTVNILAGATDKHVYLEIYSVQLPAKNIDTTYDVVDVTAGDEEGRLLRSILSEYGDGLTIEYDEYMGIEVEKSVSAFTEVSDNDYRIYLDITLPENNSFYNYGDDESEYETITDSSYGPYEIRVTDGDYNSVTYYIYVSPRKELSLDLYQGLAEYDDVDNYYIGPNDIKVKTVLLSSNGDLFSIIGENIKNHEIKLFSQDYFYAVTNATDDMIRRGFSVKCDELRDDESSPFWKSPYPGEYKFKYNVTIPTEQSVTDPYDPNTFYAYDENVSGNLKEKKISYTLFPNRGVNVDLNNRFEYEFVSEYTVGSDRKRIYKIKSVNLGVSKIWSPYKEDLYSSIEVPKVDSNGIIAARRTGTAPDYTYNNEVEIVDGNPTNKKEEFLTGIIGTTIRIQKQGSGTYMPVTNGIYRMKLTLSIGNARKSKGVSLWGYHGHCNIRLSTPRSPFLSVKLYSDTMSAPGIYNLLPSPITEKYVLYEHGLDTNSSYNGVPLGDPSEFKNFYQPDFETVLSANSDIYTDTRNGTEVYCIDMDNTITINYTASSTFKNRIFSKYGFLGGFLINKVTRIEFIHYSGSNTGSFNLYNNSTLFYGDTHIEERIHYVQGNSKTGLVLTPLSPTTGLSERYTLYHTGDDPTTVVRSLPAGELFFAMTKKIYRDHLENTTLRRRVRSDNPCTINFLKCFKSYDPGIVVINDANPTSPSDNFEETYTSAIINGRNGDSEYGTIYIRDIITEKNVGTKVYDELGRPGIFLDIPKSKFTNIGNNIYEYVTDEIYLSDFITFNNGDTYSTPKSPIRIKIRIKL